MRFATTLRAGSAGLSLFMLSALAQQPPPPDEAGAVAQLSAELDRLKRELAEQRALLRQLRDELATQRAVAAAAAVWPEVPADWADRSDGADRADGDDRADRAGRPPPGVAPAVDRVALAALRGTGPAPQSQPQPELPPPRPVGPSAPAVGQAPARDGRPPEVAPLFEAPGVLTPRGRMVLEPSFQFGYSSSNRVALVGYTIIPALLIGLVDVREVKRNARRRR